MQEEDRVARPLLHVVDLGAMHLDVARLEWEIRRYGLLGSHLLLLSFSGPRPGVYFYDEQVPETSTPCPGLL